MTINDNGRGFALPGNMDDLPREGKLGLMGMQERTWLLGGSMEITSKPDAGTTLLFSIPIKK
jgi:signal transduction histidine kinase